MFKGPISQMLAAFDRSSDWGPSSSLTRMERWRRGVGWVKNADDWRWVETLLLQFPELGRQKPNTFRSAEPTQSSRPACEEQGRAVDDPVVRPRPRAANHQTQAKGKSHKVGGPSQRSLADFFPPSVNPVPPPPRKQGLANAQQSSVPCIVDGGASREWAGKGSVPDPLVDTSMAEEAIIPSPALPPWAQPWKPGSLIPTIRPRGGPGREAETGFPV
jgi:hypothetical protein